MNHCGRTSRVLLVKKKDECKLVEGFSDTTSVTKTARVEKSLLVNLLFFYCNPIQTLGIQVANLSINLHRYLLTL